MTTSASTSPAVHKGIRTMPFDASASQGTPVVLRGALVVLEEDTYNDLIAQQQDLIAECLAKDNLISQKDQTIISQAEEMERMRSELKQKNTLVQRYEASSKHGYDDTTAKRDYSYDITDFTDVPLEWVDDYFDRLIILANKKVLGDFVIKDIASVVTIYILLTSHSSIKGFIWQESIMLTHFVEYWNCNVAPYLVDAEERSVLTALNHKSVKAEYNRSMLKESPPEQWRAQYQVANKNKKTKWASALNIKAEMERQIQALRSSYRIYS